MYVGFTYMYLRMQLKSCVTNFKFQWFENMSAYEMGTLTMKLNEVMNLK